MRQNSPPRTEYSVNQLTLARFFRSRCESAPKCRERPPTLKLPNGVVPSLPCHGARDAVSLYSPKPDQRIRYESLSALRGERKGPNLQVGRVRWAALRTGPWAPLTLPSPPAGGRRGERGRSSLFLLFRRRYPKGDDFRHGTGIRPVLVLIYQDYQVGSMRARRELRRAYSGICASRSNSKGSVRGRPRPSQFGTDVLDNTSIGRDQPP